MWFRKYLAKRRTTNMIRQGARRIVCPWCGASAAAYPAAIEPTNCSPINGGLTVDIRGGVCQFCNRLIEVYQGIHVIPWRKREEFADGCVNMTWADGSVGSSGHHHAPHSAFVQDEPVWQIENPFPEPVLPGTRLNGEN